MTQKTLATLGSVAESVPGNVTFSITPNMFRYGSKPSIMLQGLTGTETATLYVADGAGWTQVFDEVPNAAMLDYANNKTTITFNTPGLYSVTHSALSVAKALRVSY